MSNQEFGPTQVGEEVLSPEFEMGSIGVKKFIGMLDELKADEQTILRMIAEFIETTPIPDPDDPDASRDFNELMANLKEIAISKSGRADLLEQIQNKTLNRNPGP